MGHSYHESKGDSTGGIIPYKNPPALIGYYLAIASLIPCIGFLFGVAACILGIVGLVKRNQTPEIKGSVHAWIGIVLGGGMALLWGGLILLTIIAGAASN